ncbi:hypothetical protein JCM19233_6961 [Vibrio astriarenae]|nr:hypothetical protein JCM19233_6961 [Vibrio sp. C7]
MSWVKIVFGIIVLVCTVKVYADEEVQDMSDPLAVYTQGGIGYTDKGLNIKVGQVFDTGNETTMGMNIVEIKGIFGEAIGWNDRVNDDSIDSIRFRHFGVNLENGRGSQIDLTWNVDSKQGTLSYSLIQSLPKISVFNFYPLGGLGIAAGQELVPDSGGNPDADQFRDRYNLHGTYYVIGVYSKIGVSDKVWFNYNPMFLGTISGSSTYRKNAFNGYNTVLAHELAMSYQLTPRANVRYFANWTQRLNFKDGDHRIEYNYQF